MSVRLGSDVWSDVPLLLEKLASFSEGGGEGVTRLLYTKSWVEAQQFLAKRMEVGGLEVRFDRTGNLYGRMQGTSAETAVVLTGSHIDTVRNGGRYDGAYGIVAGLIALQYLKQAHGAPVRTLEVVSLCEEEGSRFPLAYWGSGNITGVYDMAAGDQVFDPDGVSLSEAIRSAGFGLDEQPACRRDDIGAYVELHIEQGVMLERMQRSIGIVETIVGQRRYAVILSGSSNHAGTTPMSMRADALAGAAEMMQELERRAEEVGDPLVATVGRLEVRPNTSNVIPGEVSFTLDIRHDREAGLAEFCASAIAAFESIARRRKLKLEVKPWLETKPVPMHQGLTELLEGACRRNGLSSMRMVSGAGHDAQLFASICPAAMLFVPSRGGVSHSPDEYTPERQLKEGAALLAACLYDLAY
jgi:allantoate deiminase